MLFRSGGGACAEEPLESWGVAVDADGVAATLVAQRLRMGSPPVLPRVQEGRLLFDVRTLLAGEDELLARAIARSVKSA